MRGLGERGVIVRAGKDLGGPGHLRVTFGTRAENDRFLQALDADAGQRPSWSNVDPPPAALGDQVVVRRRGPTDADPTATTALSPLIATLRNLTSDLETAAW